MGIVVDENLCTGCEACIAVCPYEAIKIEDGVARVLAPFCRECGYCIEGCGEEAIKME